MVHDNIKVHMWKAYIIHFTLQGCSIEIARDVLCIDSKRYIKQSVLYYTTTKLNDFSFLTLSTFFLLIWSVILSSSSKSTFISTDLFKHQMRLIAFLLAVNRNYFTLKKQFSNSLSITNTLISSSTDMSTAVLIYTLTSKLVYLFQNPQRSLEWTLSRYKQMFVLPPWAVL